MSKILFELGECKIEALEVLYNITKQELKIKEQYYLDLLKDKAVNKNNANQTKEQRRQQRNEASKKWKITHPNKRAEQNKRCRDRRAAKNEPKTANENNPE